MKRSVLDAFARLQRTHFARYTTLSLDPPIFYVQPVLDMVDDFVSSYQPLFSALGGRRAYCLFRHSCAVTPPVFEWIQQLETRCREQFPEIQLIHLCNQPGLAEQFRARGRRAVFCNQNGLVDERIFTPLPDVEKRFDAVYNARFDRVKRHYLARELSSLALIYNPTDRDLPYIREIQEQFARAHFFNHSDSGDYRILGPAEINASLNACRVGLCLSEEEGAMSASMEYLLSGLAIVTTPSPGGRDVFFEDGFVLTVPPEPEAVRQAVQELIARAVPPETIRRATLEKLRVHRATFIALVQLLYEENGVCRSFANEWEQVFVHRMLRHQSHFDTIARLDAARAEGPRGS